MDEIDEVLSRESASKLESFDIDVMEVVGVDFVNEDATICEKNRTVEKEGDEKKSAAINFQEPLPTAPKIELIYEKTEEALSTEKTGESGSPCQVLEPKEHPKVEQVETGAMEAVKASILVRKQRAQMIRQVLSRKSKMLQIKLWQKSISSSEIVEEKDEPRAKRTRSETPSPVPGMSRFSPDITLYRRRKPLLIQQPVRKESSVSGSGSTKSSGKEEENDVVKDDDDESKGGCDGGDGEDAASSDNEEIESVLNSSRSTESRTDAAAALLMATRGEAFVKLDARIVEDLIRDGKPIRAAAVAALEAVHGKKLTELEALVKLRKAYINKPLPRGRGRRSIMKKFLKPNRAPKPGYWCRVVNSVTFRNSYFQVGDIVYVKSEDGQIYFLQIHAILMDSRENEGYGKMIWITPKPDFKGKRFPFHPRNYDLRRDICPLIASLSTVTHVAHCPLDYFDGHPSFWKPEVGTIYQKFGEPLVKWYPFHNPKADTPSESTQGAVRETIPGSCETVTEGTEDVISAEIDITQMEDDAVAGN